jgi:hypothetical protein
MVGEQRLKLSGGFGELTEDRIVIDEGQVLVAGEQARQRGRRVRLGEAEVYAGLLSPEGARRDRHEGGGRRRECGQAQPAAPGLDRLCHLALRIGQSDQH